jgi:DNA replication and repair protein RecF
LFVENIRLINFRNYKKIDIAFKKGINVIYGDNAQGKTNILESIFLCAAGRSHRTSKDAELIELGENAFYIKLDFVKENNKASIEIGCERDSKKKIKVNEIPVKKIGDLIGNLNAVIFSPEDLLIIKEGPSERRRFIDITISQLKPSYFYDLQQYLKVLQQRNHLLKEIEKKKSLIDTLEIWNNNLVSIGARIIKVRNEFIFRLAEIAEKKHRELSGQKEKLIIKYSPTFDVNDFSNVKEIEEMFYKVLKQSERKEIIRGTTLFGPQRDDYDLFLNDINIKLYGSQGQQRTAILSVKLSEIDIMKQETGEMPILLLDDVMSELDSKRQEVLLTGLKEIQTFISCTDKNIFNFNNNINADFYFVKNGNIGYDAVTF